MTSEPPLPTPRTPERVFPALPALQGRGFARTWWGRAWVKALEDTALDGKQLKKGRSSARAGEVGAVSVRPGRITAVVRDRDGTEYRSDVLLQELTEEDWDRLLDMVADRAGHIAALLDRDMPPHLVEDASAAGVELLPGIGDLEAECSCDAWDHCPHTAALCYQLARLLDEDPFVLLLIRGRGERALLEDLQARSVARGAESPSGAGGESAVPGSPGGCGSDGDGAAQGVLAREAFAARVLPLPAPPPRVAEPGRPPVLGGATDPAPGMDVAALEFLAADAAARAHRLLTEALSPGHEVQPLPTELTVEQDAVRLAAAGHTPGDEAAASSASRGGIDRAVVTRVSSRLAAGSGRDAVGFALAVRAWEYGGPAALDVLEEDWEPGPEESARAGAQLTAAWADEERPPRLRATRNRWTAVGADAQLRFGRDGRWWPYRKERGRWWPAGPSGHDPAAALAVLLGAD